MKARKLVLGRLHATLKHRRNALEQLLAIGERELRTRTTDVGDDIDAALDAEHLELQSQLATSESRELAQIENALQRIAARKYGTCEVCNKEIPLARLEALPYATQCIQCQRAGETDHGKRIQRWNWRSVDERFSEPSIADDLPVLDIADATAGG